MQPFLRVFLLIVLSTVSVQAEPFGAPFAVSNTRYAAAAAEKSVLVSNGHDLYTFWSRGGKIRATRVREGDQRVGHLVGASELGWEVAWTGESFVLVCGRVLADASLQLTAQWLDPNAKPLSGPTVIGVGKNPRIAVSRDALLVAYQENNSGRLQAKVIQLEGLSMRSVAQEMGAYEFDVSTNGETFLLLTADRYEYVVRARVIDREGVVRGESVLRTPSHSARSFAIASDGTDYYAAWETSYFGDIESARIDHAGVIGTPTPISDGYQPNVIWNGAGWTVSYIERTYVDYHSIETSHFAHFDWQEHLVSREQSSAGQVLSAMTLFEGRVMSAWTNGTSKAISVVPLPLDSAAPRVATFGPGDQTLLATASSRDATVFVWREVTDTSASVHIGIRGRNGEWTERDLNTDQTDALATSDGTGFAVVIKNSYGPSYILLLDERGESIAPTILLQYPLVRAIASNGTHYAYIDSDGYGWLLDRAGTRTGPVVFTGLTTVNWPALASDGNGFLLTTICTYSSCGPGLHAARLGPGLQSLGRSYIPQTDLNWNIGVVWTGSAYVAAAHSLRQGTLLARIPAETLGVAESMSGLQTGPARSITATANGNVAITLDTGSIASIFTDRGALVGTMSIPAGSGARLLQMPDGKLGVAATIGEDTAPYQGATRVMMAVEDPSSPPEPPQLTVQRHGLRADLDWKPGSGAVNGYRLQYKVGDGSWNEVEQWFAPHELSAIRSMRPDTTYLFRVRAFNDAGMTDSNVVGLNMPRTRAVR